MYNPFPLLPHPIRNYILTSVIGHGGFATVYKATNVLYNFEFAIKVVCKSSISESVNSTYLAEVNSLTKLDHPNVIRLYDFFSEDDNMFLVLEYCSGGTLEDKINRNELITKEDKIRVCSQIISAIKYCYEMKIAHRDIKAANVLFDCNGRVKVSDFGLSGFINHGSFTNEHKGTLSYLAPEVCQRGFFDPFKSDIWSLGVLFYRMFTSNFPFEGKSKDELRENIINGFYPEILTGSMLKPIRRMLIVNPDERISICQLSKMKEFVVPLSSATLQAIPKFKSQQIDTLNIKLNRRRSSLLYNQKIIAAKKQRHHSFNQAIGNTLTFT